MNLKFVPSARIVIQSMTIMNTQPTSQQYIYYVPLKKTLPNPDICLFCLIRLFSAGETSAQMKKVYGN